MNNEAMMQAAAADFKLAKTLAISTVEGFEAAKVPTKVAILAVAIAAKSMEINEPKVWAVCQLVLAGDGSPK